MKNKKGFTLVELIAVIAILGIVITIATISISTIRRNINESQRENLQASVIIAAESYHEETGVNIVPVGTLLQIGKLKADTTNYEDSKLGIEKGDPVIIDPVSKAPINCDGVIFKNGEGTYELGAGCTKDAIIENSLTVKYATDEVLTKNSFINYSGNWLPLENPSSKLVLTVLTPSEIKGIYEYRQAASSVVKLKNTTWRVVDAPETAYVGEIYTVQIPESGKVDMEITVSGTIDATASGESNSENSEYVTKTFRLKVDARYPSIKKYFVQEGKAWTSSKNVYADVYDGESGISGWSLIKGTDCIGSTFANMPPVEGTKTVYQTVSRMGDYTVCVKDNAGHISKSETAVNVENIDTEPPVLSVEVTEGDKWKKTNSFRIVLEDKNYSGAEVIAGFNSGLTATFKYMWSATPITSCAAIPETNKVTFNLTNTLKYTSNNIAISGQTGDGNIYVCPVGIVKDQAGNALKETVVSKQMRLDNTGPECTGSDNVSWNNPSSKKVTVSYRDIHSGCDTNKTTCNTSQTYTSTIKSDSITVSDNLGNTSICSFDVKLDRTEPRCGTAENASKTWTNKNRTINQACSDGTDESGCTKDKYSNTYSTTTKTSSITIEDNAGNTKSCSFDVYVDKTAPICGNTSGESTKWTSSNRTITQNCSDGTDESGCTKSTYSEEYKTTTKTSSITIQDNAGNTQSCPIDVYVDKTAPTSSISVKSTNSKYNVNTVDITVSGSDSESGITAYCYSTSSTSCSSWQTTGTFENVNTGISATDGGSITYYGYTKDAVGNISPGASQKYTSCGTGTYEYYDCTDDGYKRNRKKNECTNKYDYEKTAKACKSDDYSCDEYGSCSTSCGSGTKTRTCYYYYGGESKSHEVEKNCTDESGCVPISCGLYVYKRDSSTLTCYWSPSDSECYWNSIYRGTKIDDLHAYWTASQNVSNPQNAGTCGGTTKNGSEASNHVAINNGKCQYACGGGTKWCDC